MLFTPGPQPRAPDVLDPGRARGLLGRRPVPAARSGAPTCRAATGTRCSPRSAAWSSRCPRRRRSIPATWTSRRSAPSGARTRSWRSWRRADLEAGLPAGRRCAGSGATAGKNHRWPRSTRPRAGPTTCCPGARRCGGEIVAEARALLQGAGFGQIDTPVFEDSDLFVRTVGEATDIVQQGDVHVRGPRRTARSRCGPRARRPCAAPTSSTACTSFRSR